MARATGIEITSSLVKIVEAESHGKTIRVLHAVVGGLPEPKDRLPDEKIAEVVSALMRGKKIGASFCVSCIDSSESIVREISLPFKSDENIRKTVKYEMESHVHHAPIEDMVVDFTKVFQGEQKTESELLFVAAAPRASVARAIRILEQAGTEPVTVDFDMLAAFNAFNFTGTFDAAPTCILLLIEPDKIKMLLVDEKQPRIARSLHLSSPTAQGKSREGAKPSPQRSASQQDLPATETAQPGDAPMNIDDAAVQKLAMELERMTLSAVPTNPPTVVIVAANEAAPELLANLATRLQARCGLPVVPTNVLAQLGKSSEVESELPNAAMAIPVGLALRGLNLAGASMNFRREELAYHRGIDTIKLSSIWTMALACVLLVLLAVYARQRLRNAEKQVEDLFAEHRSLFAEIYPDHPVPAGVTPLEELIKLRAEDQRLFGEGSHPLPISALEYWKELFGRIGAPKVFTVEALEISLSKERMTMKGITGDMPTAEQVLTNIKGVTEEQKSKYPVFQNARAPEYKYTKEQMIQYTYEIQWSK